MATRAAARSPAKPSRGGVARRRGPRESPGVGHDARPEGQLRGPRLGEAPRLRERVDGREGARGPGPVSRLGAPLDEEEERLDASGLLREARAEEELLGAPELAAADLEARPLEDGESGGAGPPRLDAAELGDGAVQVAELLLHRAEVEADAPGEGSRTEPVVSLPARGAERLRYRGEERLESLRGLGEAAARAPEAGELEAGRAGLGGVGPGEGAPLSFGGEALGELEVALRPGRVDEEPEDVVGEVLRLAPPQLSRHQGRRGVVAPRLGEEGEPEGGGLPGRPFPLERLGPERLEPPSFARRRPGPGGDEAREGHGVEPGLERVEGCPQRAPGDGPLLPLEEREEELESAEPVPLLEAQARGGEARGDVEEVVGGDVALEPDEGLVDAAEPAEGAGGEEVEAAVGVARRRKAVELAEAGEDAGPVLRASGLRGLLLEVPKGLRGDGRRVGGGRRGARRERGEREERGDGPGRARDALQRRHPGTRETRAPREESFSSIAA